MRTPGSHPGLRRVPTASALTPGRMPIAPPPVEETPILLLKVRTDLNSADAADDVPTDISAFAVFPADAECVLPPGAYLEQKREWTESIGGMDADGGEGPAKVVEVVPHMPRGPAPTKEAPPKREKP